MKVAILFDDVDSRPDSTVDERGVLDAVRAVGDALTALGHQVQKVPATFDLEEWTTALRQDDPPLVFNLCEGLGGRSEGEVLAARAVEEMGIPLTGSSHSILALARRKDRVNTLLAEKGLPVPSWDVWDGFSRVRWASAWSIFPAIVKPAAEDGSVGITQASIVHDQEGLAERLLEAADLAPLIVQAFVGTREINATIVGGAVLPLSEISFTGLPAGHFPMVDYSAKWELGSPEDRGTEPICPAPLPGPLAARIRLLALRAWRAIGGTGYGRIDFRITEPDTLHILEVNPNPDLAPTAGLVRAAQVQGWDYPTLVDRIMAGALERSAVRT